MRRRARALARGGFWVAHCPQSHIATLAWQLKWALSGERLDFRLNMQFVQVCPFVNHARSRARSIPRCRN
eukprot:7966035-Pyramimonas_sp.AAC.1